MPNWCEGDLRIEGPVESLRIFADKVNGDRDKCNHYTFDPATATEIVCGERGLHDVHMSESAVGCHAFEARAISILDALLPTPEALTKITSPFRGTPEEAAALIAEYGSTDWYDWNIAHWGVKWADVGLDSENSLLEVTDEYEEDGVRRGWIEHSFETPWAAPSIGLAAVSEQFPDLTFELAWFEAGMGVNGRFKCEGGEITEYESGRYFGGRGG
jgi:Api92-like protein with ferredoxin domain